MALLIDGNTEYVLVVDHASYQNKAAFTWMAWIYRNALKEAFLLFKGVNKAWAFDWSDTDEISMEVIRAGTDANARSQNQTFGTGTWYFLAATYDESDGPRLFYGTLTSPIAEVSSYAARTVGTLGTTNDSGSNLLLGNRGVDDARYLGGAMANFIWINSRLTVAQMRRWQYSLTPVGTSAIYLACGLLGTTAPDWSGNRNNGSVNGATYAAHVPITMTRSRIFAPLMGVTGSPAYYYAQL